MAYGTGNRSEVETAAEALRASNPDRKYEVKEHDKARGTWGIVQYIPYCEQMPFRCTGFLWMF